VARTIWVAVDFGWLVVPGDWGKKSPLGKKCSFQEVMIVY